MSNDELKKTTDGSGEFNTETGRGDINVAGHIVGQPAIYNGFKLAVGNAAFIHFD